MKRPFRWSSVIAPAAYEALLPLVGAVAFVAASPKVYVNASETFATRPLAGAVISVVWVLIGVGVLLALCRRVWRLMVVVRLWRRQRRGA